MLSSCIAIFAGGVGKAYAFIKNFTSVFLSIKVESLTITTIKETLSNIWKVSE